jgi:hypothetical protein
MTNTCKHEFTIIIPVDEMTAVPPMVQRGGQHGVIDRKCSLCGAVSRAWGSVWAKYDRDRTPNTCETCKFFDEVAPADDEDHYDLGLCCIQRDRLPLWIKDCGCDTYVHSNWENCPTWTEPLAPGTSDIPVEPE